MADLSNTQGEGFRAGAIAALAAGPLLGILMFGLSIRNRVYLVHVTRYINEHRKHFREILQGKLRPVTDKCTDEQE